MSFVAQTKMIFILFLLTLASAETNILPGLIEALAKMRPLSELSLILSDFKQQKSINQLDLPLATFDLEQLLKEIQQMTTNEPCPVYRNGIGTLANSENSNEDRPLVFVDQNALYERPRILPWDFKGRMLVFIVGNEQDVDIIALLLAKSVLRCEQRVDTGLLDPRNRILLILEKDAKIDAEAVFGHEELRRHRRLALIKECEQEENKFLFTTFDPVQERSFVSHILSLEEISDMEETFIWPLIKDYQGKRVRVGANVWAYVVVADALDKSLVVEKNQTQTNFWGLEVAMLEEASRNLNFEITYYSHPESLYGDLLSNGQWSGLVGWAVEDRVDLSLTMLYGHSRFQMVAGSPVILSMHMTFAAPWPSLYPKSFAIVRPFYLDAWIAVLITFVVLGLFFYSLAKKEGDVRGLFFREWAILDNSFWYCYGTMVGEAITRDTKTHLAPALRTVVGVWTLYCFIISASYAGNLKTFLLSRELLPPINTLADVLESELPWKMILYGEVEETIMAQSEDPVMQNIWRDKLVVPAYDIKDVYEGNSIFIDYSTGLEVPLRLVYSSPDGQPFIHISPVPMMRPSYMVWAFNKLNPLKEPMDAFMKRFLEAGLVNYWTEKTFAGMRLQARERGEGNLTPHVRPSISPMNLDDLQGAFFLFAILIALSLIYFFVFDCPLCRSRQNEIDWA